MNYQNITNKVETLIEKFKPIAENFCNLKLEDIAVESSSHGLVEYKPNKVSVNPRIIDIIDNEDLLELLVAEGLGEHIVYTLNPKAFEFLISKDNIKVKIIMGGFKNYFCFNVLPKNMLSDDIIGLANLVLNTYDAYNKGYNFFRIISSNLGKEEIFNVIKNLDVTLEELENPDLYIERRKK